MASHPGLSPYRLLSSELPVVHGWLVVAHACTRASCCFVALFAAVFSVAACAVKGTADTQGGPVPKPASNRGLTHCCVGAPAAQSVLFRVVALQCFLVDSVGVYLIAVMCALHYIISEGFWLVLPRHGCIRLLEWSPVQAVSCGEALGGMPTCPFGSLAVNRKRWLQ